MIEIQTPNLDGMDEEDLSAFRDEAHKTIETLHKLKEYAACTVLARKLRFSGEIARAVNLEGQAERIYKALPDWARW